jgi:RNA polymerase sigma-70 factor (ECF subfamily)
MAGEDPRALTRDVDGFDHLYARYHRRLYRFIHRLARRRDVADDLFQEAWLRLARNWAQAAAIEDIEGWLFTVARNATSARATEGLRHLPSPDPAGPEQAVQASEAVTRLERAFEALSEEDRAVLWLVAVEGMDQQRIGSILGIGHAAARQRVTRARIRLAEQTELLEAPAAALPGRKGSQS